MTLARRTKRLEEDREAQWREAWRRFTAYLDRHDHPPAWERLEQRDTLNDMPEEELDARWYASQERHGTAALVAWLLATIPFPDPDEIDLTRWPHLIEPPPPEPKGAWEALTQQVSDPSPDGLNAAMNMWALSYARAVRELRAHAET